MIDGTMSNVESQRRNEWKDTNCSKSLLQLGGFWWSWRHFGYGLDMIKDLGNPSFMFMMTAGLVSSIFLVTNSFEYLALSRLWCLYSIILKDLVGIAQPRKSSFVIHDSIVGNHIQIYLVWVMMIKCNFKVVRYDSKIMEFQLRIGIELLMRLGLSTSFIMINKDTL